MVSLERQFGFYPYALEIDTGRVKISTLPRLEKTVEKIEGHKQVAAEWYYSPQRASSDPFTGKITRLPYPRRIFQLPKTHLLQVSNPASSDPELHIKFYVWCLSFFVGMRLTTEEAGFVDSTPIKVGKLVDFNAKLDCKILHIIDDFWTNNSSSDVANSICAAIHSLFLSQNPQNLEYEIFSYLYMASDACYEIARKLKNVSGREPHNRRIEWVCQNYGLPCPIWAQATPLPGTIKVSDIRNSLAHEALWDQQPLGFSTKTSGITGNLNLQFKALVCRLIVAVMGCSTNSYLKSLTNTRQRYLLDLI
jgi:hypothetical protein